MGGCLFPIELPLASAAFVRLNASVATRRCGHFLTQLSEAKPAGTHGDARVGKGAGASGALACRVSASGRSEGGSIKEAEPAIVSNSAGGGAFGEPGGGVVAMTGEVSRLRTGAGKTELGEL